MKNNLALLFLIVFFFACEKSDSIPCDRDDGRGQLISAVDKGTISTEYLQSLLDDWDVDLGRVPEYDVNIFSIVYETIDWQGITRQASGAIFVPDTDSESGFPLLSAQHGTETVAINVASVTPLFAFESLFSASAGYVTCSPDYLGLGISTDVFHPYIHASVAHGVIDMVRASESFACENDIKLNGQIFLMGYSEGGYVTMAVHKEMEQEFPGEFNIIASAPMAGPHDVLGTALESFSSEEFAYPSYFGYVAAAYSSIYGWDRMDEFFQPPYANKIWDLFDGTHTLSDINNELTPVIKDLVPPEFLAGLLGDGEQELKAAFKENSLLDWSPIASIRLYHSDADDAVPYSNAVTALKELGQRGADIELITISGATHVGGAIPAIAGALEWFDTLKE